MKNHGQKTLLTLAAGATALLVSTSLLAMPFCGNKYGKRYNDPYMMSYIPGHGGYVPMQYYGYQPMHHAPSAYMAPHVHHDPADNSDKEAAAVETKTY